MPAHATNLFLFRRDLRVDDNVGLIEALEQSRAVVPAFILDPTLLANPTRSANAIQFMTGALRDLAGQLKVRGGHLHLLAGRPADVLARLTDTHAFSGVFFNEDVTPYSKRRDDQIARVARDRGMACHPCQDLFLVDPRAVATQKGTPYTVFTWFHKKASQRVPPSPRENALANFARVTVPDDLGGTLDHIPGAPDPPSPDLFTTGGRATALELLDRLPALADYETARDVPARRGTTGLSAHLHWGAVSIRETYHAIRASLGPDHPLLRQLYWRDFFSYLGFHFPHVFHHAFREKYEDLPWVDDPARFERWCTGTTGVPIVDAGMRELNATGYMHNRVRMLVASFLTKDLHIDWRRGELYFARHLVDFDKAVNNGNWQWAASTGADAQPYFRVFNPWTQQKKYDPECAYIKRWVPELAGLAPRAIHALRTSRPEALTAYPVPMVDHQRERELAKLMYKR